LIRGAEQEKKKKKESTLGKKITHDIGHPNNNGTYNNQPTNQPRKTKK
jgi:hypothetical protein